MAAGMPERDSGFVRHAACFADHEVHERHIVDYAGHVWNRNPLLVIVDSTAIVCRQTNRMVLGMQSM